MKMKRTKRESEQDLDVDQDFLDRVLNKLYDFGDGPDDKQSKKKHKKRKRMKEEEEEEDVAAQEENTDKIRSKEDRSPTTDAISSKRISASTSADSESSGRKASAVEVVTFQDPRKKNKVKQTAEPERTVSGNPDEAKEKKKKKEPDVLSMEKARLDVHRFGITGFQKQQQRVFEQDRAIMLGARPPKKDYVNYKVFQQMIKEKKSKEKQDEDKSDAQKKKRKSSGKQKNVKRKSGSSGGEPTGHVGRFKNGMLVLSPKDIQKLNRKNRK